MIIFYIKFLTLKLLLYCVLVSIVAEELSVIISYEAICLFLWHLLWLLIFPQFYLDVSRCGYIFIIFLGTQNILSIWETDFFLNSKNHWLTLQILLLYHILYFFLMPFLLVKCWSFSISTKCLLTVFFLNRFIEICHIPQNLPFYLFF